MEEEDLRLSEEQMELVAIGASIGSGCRPCLDYHLKAGAEVGLSAERLSRAAASAEQAAAEAAEAMRAYLRARLAAEPKEVLPVQLDDALASFGAALGANDLPNIERHLLAALELGAWPPQLIQAIEVSRAVKERATQIYVREAIRLIEGDEPADGENAGEITCCADSCSCDTRSGS